MQAILDRAALNGALNLAKRAVERKSPISVLTNVMITRSDTGARVTTTDLDRWIMIDVPGSADHDFATAVPAHQLIDMVKSSGADMVAIDADNGPHTVIDLEGSRALLSATPVADFPEFPGLDGDGVVRFTMLSDELADMFRRTEFAISTEETRYYLNGVYLHAMGDELRVVATDGHRLAKVTRALPAGAAGMPGVIVPRKTVADVLALIGKRKPPVPVHVSITPQRIEFRAGMVTIRSKTVDGTFPDYQRVIPSGNDRIAGFNRAELSAAVKTVSTVSSERGKAFKLAIAQHAKMADLSVTNAEGGAMSASVTMDPGMSLFEAGIEIGFNARYVLDILAVMGGPRVLLAMSDPGSPAVWTDPADSSFVGVQMPMRV